MKGEDRVEEGIEGARAGEEDRGERARGYDEMAGRGAGDSTLILGTM